MKSQLAPIHPLPAARDEASFRSVRSSARNHRSDVRLEPTRRGRFVITAAAFLLGLLVAAAALLALDLPSALADSDSSHPSTVVVESGDTLWGYAEQYAPEDVSAEVYITQIRELNHLPTARLTAGEEIRLPAEGAAQH